MSESNYFLQNHLQDKSISILKQIDLANLLTLTGLGLSFISTIFAIQKNFDLAIIALMGAGIADVFDGYIARKIKRRSQLQAEIGKQLDNLVDICAFGFNPAIFGFCFGLDDFLSILILISYVCAGCLRLAFFNSVGLIRDDKVAIAVDECTWVPSIGERSKEYFIGLPVTCVAFILPVVFGASFFVSGLIVISLLKFTYFLFAILMVSPLRIIKPQGYWYGVIVFVSSVMTGIYLASHFRLFN